MEKFSLKQIQVDTISESKRYSTRFKTDSDLLLPSIKKFGLLSPLWISDGQLIAGFNRLDAAKQCGLKEVSALVFSGMDDTDCFYAALISNMNMKSRELDAVVAFGKALDEFHLSDDEVLGEVLPLLGFDSRKRSFDLLRSISKFDPEILSAVDQGKLPYRGIEALSIFNDQTRNYVVNYVVSYLHVSSQQLMKLCEWISDLLLSRGCAIEELLIDSSLQSLLEREFENANQRTALWIEELKKMRFPEMYELRSRFSEEARNILDDKTSVRIPTPETFEEQGFKLEARVQSPEDLAAVLEHLSQKKNALSALFDII